ncbi:tripartite tricarboxylate transporter permease [Salipiger sp.]|uniref:tripartite tricarboxylate transporter permease n=1 Tax=Salipiger sp. TaxID=2078585 RepID=UPI003A981C26
MDAVIAGFGSFGTLGIWIALVIGLIIGYFIGAVPGLGPSLGIALLIPFTYGMDPRSALVMLIALYMAAEYGGAITAILLNSPGTAAAVPTSWDGYALTRKGKAELALAVSIISSFAGVLTSALLLMLTAVPLSEVALKFGPAQYAALALAGLCLVALISEGSMVKGLVAITLGLALATVGMDVQTGVPRFSPSPDFFEGLPLVPVLLGLYALSEVLFMISEGPSGKKPTEHLARMLTLPLSTLRRLSAPILRSSLIGYALGVIPGAGTVIASFASYGIAKRISKTPEDFGNGSLEGIASSEAANNAAVSGSLAPLLALGIPGSGTGAILIGALMIHGLQPGPLLFTRNPEIPYTIMASLFVGAPLMLLVGLGGGGLWARVTALPRQVIATAVFLVCIVGAYASENAMFPVYVMCAFGVIGYIFRLLQIPLAPVVLSLILGEMLEVNFRRAFVQARGDMSVYLTDPLTMILLVGCVLCFAGPAWSWLRSASARPRVRHDP